MAACPATAREEHIWVEGIEVGKVVNQVVNYAYVVPSVDASELYLLASKDQMVREGDAEIQGDAEEGGQQCSGDDLLAQPVILYHSVNLLAGILCLCLLRCSQISAPRLSQRGSYLPILECLLESPINISEQWRTSNTYAASGRKPKELFLAIETGSLTAGDFEG